MICLVYFLVHKLLALRRDYLKVFAQNVYSGNSGSWENVLHVNKRPNVVHISLTI